MVKVFYRESESKSTVNIKLINNRLLLTVGNHSLTLDVAETFDTYSNEESDFIVSVYHSDEGFLATPYRVRASRAFEKQILSAKDYYMPQNMTVAIQIFFSGKNNFAFTVPFYQLGECEGVEKVLCEESKYPHIEVQKLFPSYAQRKEKMRKKTKLLVALDCNDSLSGNECQVDILTKIVEVLANKYPNEVAEVLPNYKQFFDRARETSILTLKTETQCIADMTKQKQAIRKAQEEYFNE